MWKTLTKTSEDKPMTPWIFLSDLTGEEPFLKGDLPWKS
jgi:hypothetical protein